VSLLRNFRVSAKLLNISNSSFGSSNAKAYQTACVLRRSDKQAPAGGKDERERYS